MTNEFLLSNIHLIRMAVDSWFGVPENFHNALDKDWEDMWNFQRELEKQANLGDSP